MFQDFANVWTPVEDASLLKKKPLAVRLAGEDLVLFRDANGKAHALVDRCPHRSVVLSQGTVDENGCLACPFHGWQFDGGGKCAHVPFNALSDAKRERFSVPAFATEEAGGLIWVYTGFGQAPAFEPPPLMRSNDFFFTPIYENWKTHWTRAMENMLDSPHLPFAHAKTIGRDMKKSMRKDSVMDINVEETPHGFKLKTFMDGADTGGHLSWYRPNCSILEVTLPNKTMIAHIFCIPLNAEHTKMIIVQTTPTKPWAFMKPFKAYVNRKILFEDRQIVESSFPQEAPDPAEERSVGTDVPTLIFRRYYLKKLKGTSASAEGLPQKSFSA